MLEFDRGQIPARLEMSSQKILGEPFFGDLDHATALVNQFLNGAEAVGFALARRGWQLPHGLDLGFRLKGAGKGGLAYYLPGLLGLDIGKLLISSLFDPEQRTSFSSFAGSKMGAEVMVTHGQIYQLAGAHEGRHAVADANGLLGRAIYPRSLAEYFGDWDEYTALGWEIWLARQQQFGPEIITALMYDLQLGIKYRRKFRQKQSGSPLGRLIDYLLKAAYRHCATIINSGT